MGEKKSLEFMIGEIHAIVKSHDELLNKMAVSNSSNEKTIALLSKVCTENSGMIKDIQNRISTEIQQSGNNKREIDELKKNNISILMIENIINKALSEVESKHESKFAVKLVQTIVFTGMGIIATAVLYGVSTRVTDIIGNVL